MALDTSIYQTLRPVEMPSMLDSQQKAMSLSQASMQNQMMMKKAQEAEKEAQYTNHLRKASVFGNAMASMAGMTPEQRAATYPKVRAELLQSGVVKPEDLPPDHDEGFYAQNMQRWNQSKEGIERQLQSGQVAKNQAEIKHLGTQDKHLGEQGRHLGFQNRKLDAETDFILAGKGKSGPKQEFESLPKESQVAIEKLAGSTANKESIRNQIKATLDTLDNPQIPYEQKLMAGKNLLKTLNSTEGADAVGEGEASRLGAFLDNLPLNRPGWMPGPQLDKFRDQVAIKHADIDRAVAANKSQIQGYYGKGAPSEAGTSVDSPALRARYDGGLGGLIQNAVAAPKEAGPKVQPSPMDMEAMHWAQKNPDHPKAQAVLQSLKARGIR